MGLSVIISSQLSLLLLENVGWPDVMLQKTLPSATWHHVHPHPYLWWRKMWFCPCPYSEVLVKKENIKFWTNPEAGEVRVGSIVGLVVSFHQRGDNSGLLLIQTWLCCLPGCLLLFSLQYHLLFPLNLFVSQDNCKWKQKRSNKQLAIQWSCFFVFLLTKYKSVFIEYWTCASMKGSRRGADIGTRTIDFLSLPCGKGPWHLREFYSADAADAGPLSAFCLIHKAGGTTAMCSEVRFTQSNAVQTPHLTRCCFGNASLGCVHVECVFYNCWLFFFF